MQISLEKVSNEQHHELKVAAQDLSQFNANIHLCHIVVDELVSAAQYYPIFLAKDSDTGQFQPIALFGLALDENIYQQSGLWKKCYLPLKLASQPFFLLNEPDAPPSLAINRADPRVQLEQGLSLFEDGVATAYLQQQASRLSELTKGFALNQTFVSALTQHQLIEPIELDIQFSSGQHSQLEGLYTINKEALAKVDVQAQQQFEQRGYVALIGAMLGSIDHVQVLIDLKNQLGIST